MLEAGLGFLLLFLTIIVMLTVIGIAINHEGLRERIELYRRKEEGQEFALMLDSGTRISISSIMVDPEMDNKLPYSSNKQK